jgi:hypothetical protein
MIMSNRKIKNKMEITNPIPDSKIPTTAGSFLSSFITPMRPTNNPMGPRMIPIPKKESPIERAPRTTAIFPKIVAINYPLNVS